MGTKSKSSGNGSAKKKNKNKSKLGTLNSVAMKNQAPKPNPFDSIWSRRKFDILGKKRKGEERRIGLSRSVAIEKRKKTLLKEYEQSGKSSAFVDKRIGEQNEGLGEFDKAILRSQRERQLKLKKTSKYNLSDGEEDEFDIQGNGSFSAWDDFEDEVPLDADEDAEDIGRDKKSNIFGQVDPHGAGNSLEGRLEGQRQKSKKEVMEEIILKSKFFKAQKAKDKEENEHFIEQLDKDFASLVQSDALLSMTQPEKMKALKALVNKNVSVDHAEKEGTSGAQLKKQEKPDFYDKLVGEMALDIRARPSDRIKTPEEIAQEEKERLEQLEEERQKRVVGADDSSDEDTDDANDKEAYTKQLRPISGDALSDSFSHDAERQTKLGLIAELLRKENEDDFEHDDDDDEDASEDSEDEEEDDDEEGSDEDADDYGKSQSLKDWEQSDDDVDGILEDGEGEEEDEDDEEEKEDISMRMAMNNDKKPSGSKGREKDSLDDGKAKVYVKKDLDERGELPYTIEAPKTFEEFSALVENRSDDQVVEAIRRIRTFNAISVAAENRKKMQVFYGVLLQYFAVLANQKPLNFKLLNLLTKPLMEMSSEIPYFAAICARQRLLCTRTQFCEDVKNTGKSSWPSLKTLFLLRLWSMIFPCSDFRHVVMTPAILLMCEYLMRCPIMSGRDVTIGSFLCSMVLSVCRQSQKYCPEAIVFIQTLLMAAFDTNQGPSEDPKFYHLMEIKALRPLLCLHSRVDEINSLDFLMLMDLPDDSPHFTSDAFRASMLFAIIETLKGSVNIYEGFKSFPEIFLPISKLLSGMVKQDHMPDALQVQIKDANQLIEKKVQEYHLLRQPLKTRKPKMIKTETPKFEENFVKGRDYDPDRERAQRKKLKKLLRQEAKGAARELRKDNYFLLEVKERERAQLGEERAEKYGKAKAFLQEQEHAFKSGQLGGKRKRRR